MLDHYDDPVIWMRDCILSGLRIGRDTRDPDLIIAVDPDGNEASYFSLGEKQGWTPHGSALKAPTDTWIWVK